MNDPLEMQSGAEAQRWVDLLVDGELDDARQRQALLALESLPDGWRKCALAFVEAQTLKREMRGMIAEPAEGDRRVATTKLIGRSSRFGALRWLAIAACVALAFALGTMTQSGKEIASSEVARSGDHATTLEKSVAVVTPATNEANSPTKIQTYRVSIPSADGQTEQSVEVPMVEGSEKDLQSMLAEKQIPVLSDAELKTLESMGHKVQQHRTYYPVQLEDGRQGVVPMDLVEVHENSDWQ